MHQSDTLTSEDQVTLINGGYRMRLVQREHEVCLCEWVDEQGQKRTGFFEAHTLKPWTPEEGESSHG